MNKKQIIEIITEKRDFLKKKFGFKEIFIFGSIAKNKVKKNSDLDVLVEIEKNEKTYKNHLEAKDFLGKLCNRKIDLVYKDSMHPIIQLEVNHELIKI